MPPVLPPNPPNRAAGTTPVQTKRAKTLKRPSAPRPTKAPSKGEHSPTVDKAPVMKNTTLTGGSNGR